MVFLPCLKKHGKFIVCLVNKAWSIKSKIFNELKVNKNSDEIDKELVFYYCRYAKGVLNVEENV